MAEPSIIQWRALFALAERLRALAPWERLKPEHIVAVELDDTVWNCAFFRDAAGFGVSCLRGADGLVRYLELLDAQAEQRQHLSESWREAERYPVTF